jgi:5-oxoprolinase (ATP-hydrolysing)
MGSSDYRQNHLVIERVVPLKRESAIGTAADPVMLEVFNNLFMSNCRADGHLVQNTAYSVNIKERLDVSCAIFAADSTLVANAPHMPVHLGSMDRAIETVIRENQGTIAPGDVYVINAPYNGGTHLPDITVCTPVFDGAQREILFWVASRGHHADVGGISPGRCPRTRPPSSRKASISTISSWSMPGNFASRRSDLLNGAKYPARNPLQNVNDIKAQVAANEKGVQELHRWWRSSRCRW